MGKEIEFFCHQDGNGEDREIRVEGELDFGTTPEFMRQIRRCMESGAKRLRLDFSAVTFIDSEAIKAILSTTHELQEGGGSLKLIKWSPVVHRTLSFLGLDVVLEAAQSDLP